MLGVSTDHCELETRNSQLETFFGRRSAAPTNLLTIVTQGSQSLALGLTTSAPMNRGWLNMSATVA
jgi:hypothetical protein